MANDLVNLDGEQLRELVQQLPANKRAAFSKAAKAACQHLRDSKQNYSKAFEIASAMVENWWEMGRAIKRLPLDPGGRPSSKTSPPGEEFLKLSDLGINFNQSSRCQRLAELERQELDQWIGNQYDEDKYNLPTLKGASTKAHVAQNTANEEWYTPPEFINAARTVMQGIDLDPASSEVAQQTVNANEYFSEEDDGLSKEWRGRVWMNPPYSAGVVEKFTDKLCQSFSEGSVTQAIALTNNSTDTSWWQRMAEHCSAACFPERRIKFLDEEGNPSGAPLQGQAIVYLGDNVDGFLSEFSAFGICLIRE